MFYQLLTLSLLFFWILVKTENKICQRYAAHSTLYCIPSFSIMRFSNLLLIGYKAHKVKLRTPSVFIVVWTADSQNQDHIYLYHTVYSVYKRGTSVTFSKQTPIGIHVCLYFISLPFIANTGNPSWYSLFRENGIGIQLAA